MTLTIDKTVFAPLDAEGRLTHAIIKEEISPGRFGFRGELALKFQQTMADEKRPPELSAWQVFVTAREGEPAFELFMCYMLSFEYLSIMLDVVGHLFKPGGKYFIYSNNQDLLQKYRITINGVLFYCLPIGEATAYNEFLELLFIDKNDIKKLNTAGKMEYIVNEAMKFDADWEEISYEEGIKRMGPVRNPNENRPV
ncbi:hypothetical protein [Beijerinckia indica]|uniref:Uncharacterized protein n=1 Tax=Beijerinckia indica subsp. indica (strain ATCC 9039 / DSM 1715 / NCIMB 8712) TaxID=395963 RepID=B2IE40_BEII9|nr:hypothetical protein [Beijerinckia indica]ACB94064.1 conserved hypothetical protein [Beijerinckia indica subsp. indica ATCC 9039]